MRAMLTILLLSAATVSAVVFIWQGTIPDATRSVQLCERVRTLDFDQKTAGWVERSVPQKSLVVCAVPGTTGDLKIEGLIEPYVDTPLADRMISVDCYKSARIKSGALSVQMPDGLYCNIPVIVK